MATDENIQQIDKFDRYTNFISRVGIPGVVVFVLLYELHTFLGVVVSNQVRIMERLDGVMKAVEKLAQIVK